MRESLVGQRMADGHGDTPAWKVIAAKPQGVVYVDDVAERLGIGGPVADFDWNKATVVLKVPVHATATTTPAEIEVTLGQFAALLAHATGAQLVKEDGNA